MDDVQLRSIERELDSARANWQSKKIIDLSRQLIRAIAAGTTDDGQAALRFKALCYQGDALRRLGNSEEALVLYRQYQEEADPQSSHAVKALNRQIFTLIHQGELERAREKLDITDKLAAELDDENGRAEVRRLRGIWAWFRGDPTSALPSLYQALKQYEKLRNLDKQMHIWANIGLVHHDLGQLDKAANGYREALKFSRLTNESISSLMLNNLGECAQDLYDVETALQYHEEALEILQKQPSTTGHYASNMAELHRNLGIDRFYLGDIASSRQHLQKALAYLEKEPHLEIQLQTLSSFGLLELKQGNLKTAWNYARQLHRLAEENQAQGLLARAYYLLGLCHLAEEEIEEGRELLQRCQFMAHESGQQMLLWRVHAALGETAVSPELAAVHYQIAAETIYHILVPIEDIIARKKFLSAAEVQELLTHVEDRQQFDRLLREPL